MKKTIASRMTVFCTLLLLLPGFLACKGRIGERKEELYSRHLQKKIKLMVWNTPVPDNKSDFNLLLLNHASDFEEAKLPELLKELTADKKIKPLMVVAISGEQKYFGVSGDGKVVEKNREAEKYGSFILNELLPYVKKQSGVRKFQQTALAGKGRAGITALDLGWHHADKIQAVGAFEPDYRMENDTPEIFSLIKASRKRPKTTYWFYDPSPEGATEMVTALIADKVKPEIAVETSALSDEEALRTFIHWAFAR